MGKASVHIKEELIAMVRLFEKGATLTQVSTALKIKIDTIRSRRTILLRIDVKTTATMLHGRGYGIPSYKLAEPIENAVAKVEIEYSKKKEPKEKTSTSSSKEYDEARSAATHCGRNPGYGIESWHFMTYDRYKAYKDWCKPWTSEDTL